jgi:hypothetical protein
MDNQYSNQLVTYSIIRRSCIKAIAIGPMEHSGKEDEYNVKQIAPNLVGRKFLGL